MVQENRVPVKQHVSIRQLPVTSKPIHFDILRCQSFRCSRPAIPRILRFRRIYPEISPSCILLSYCIQDPHKMGAYTVTLILLLRSPQLPTSFPPAVTYVARQKSHAWYHRSSGHHAWWAWSCSSAPGTPAVREL